MEVIDRTEEGFKFGEHSRLDFSRALRFKLPYRQPDELADMFTPVDSLVSPEESKKG